MQAKYRLSVSLEDSADKAYLVPVLFAQLTTPIVYLNI